jgi:hypothetical protein
MKEKTNSEKAANIAKAREQYERRAENRPKQVWEADTKTWSKVAA